jgi:hypothetical protein
MLGVKNYGCHLSLRRTKTEFGSPQYRRASFSISVTAGGQLCEISAFLCNSTNQGFRTQCVYKWDPLNAATGGRHLRKRTLLLRHFHAVRVIGQDSYQMH